MIERRPDYYTQFRCLGGACPDTCCQDWSVVPDQYALADYTAAPAPLGERIAQNLVTDEDGDVCFRLDEGGRCALLTPDGLCAIQRDWGEAHLCAHCAAYPRFAEEYGCLTETSLALSCPEAARLLLDAPRFTLTEMDDGRDQPPFEDIDPDLLSGLEHSRAQALALLDGGPAPIWDKLRAVLSYAQTLQYSIDSGGYGQLPTRQLSPIFQLDPLRQRAPAIRLLGLLAGLDPLRPSWPALLRERAAQLSALSQAEYAVLRQDYERANPRWERQLTNLACYLVFRHWHKAVNDDALYGRASFLCAACAVCYHLALFQPGEEAALWPLFSREVEHDEDNLSTLIWTLSDWFPSELFEKGAPPMPIDHAALSDHVALGPDHASVIILDQTLLPNQVSYLTLREPEEMFEAIQLLRVRGAPAIGICAGYCLAALAEQRRDLPPDQFSAELHRLAQYLNSSRPTAVNLSWALDRLGRRAHAMSGAAPAAVAAALRQEAIAIHEEDIAMCRAISEYGLTLLRDGAGVLTHCNAGPLATSRYGTALGPLLLGKERGMSFRVYADETRPLLQGARLTAYELHNAGIDVTLICDNMASMVMKNGWIDACFVGCDRVAANGDAANKIGTSGVAILARHYGIPFYVLGPTSTIDLSCPTGDDIQIELRDPEEIRSKFYAQPMAPAGVKCYNPAFDVTDHSLIAGIVTEKGICRPPYTQSLAALFE